MAGYDGAIHHVVLDYDDIGEVLMENDSVGAGGMIASGWLDVSHYHEIQVFVKTVKTCTTSIQLAYTGDENPDAFDLYNPSGSLVTLSTSVAGGATYLFQFKAMQMRVVVKNNDTAADTPIVVVM